MAFCDETLVSNVLDYFYASYCPTFADFTPNLGNSINMDLISSGVWESDSITYNGPQPISATLRWYASGQSSYPGLPELPPYNNAYSRNLALNPGDSFTLTVGGISFETNLTVNAKAFTCSL